MTTKDMGLWLVSLIIIWIITIGAIFAIIELLVPAIGGLFGERHGGTTCHFQG